MCEEFSLSSIMHLTPGCFDVCVRLHVFILSMPRLLAEEMLVAVMPFVVVVVVVLVFLYYLFVVYFLFVVFVLLSG